MPEKHYQIPKPHSTVRCRIQYLNQQAQRQKHLPARRQTELKLTQLHQ